MNSEIKKKVFKKMIIYMNVIVLSIFSVYSIIFKTLYIKAETDISFMIPIFIDVIPHLTDICEVIGILVAYAFIIYSFYRFDRAEVRLFIISFCLQILYKYLVTFAVTYIINGSLPTVRSLISDLVLAFAIPFLLELLMLAILLHLTNKTIGKAIFLIKEKKALEAKLPDYTFDERKVFFPFKKIFDFKNPLQKCAMYSGLIITLSKLLQLVIIDIQVGLPSSIAEFVWMVIYYSANIILGLLSYLFILWMLISIDTASVKLKYKN